MASLTHTGFQDLEERYVSIRKTRPDGNCFYRAFVFAYLESLFGDKAELDRFLQICDVTRKGISSLGFPDFTVDEFYEYVPLSVYSFLLP